MPCWKLTHVKSKAVFIRVEKCSIKVDIWQIRRKFLFSIAGVASQRNAILSGEDKSIELVAEVCAVIGRLPCNGISVGLEDDNQFILWHQRFVSVDFLLRPEVSLYFVDDTKAFFVETPSDLDLHNTEKHPFFYMAQQDFCTHVIILPLENFLILSNTVGEPKCQLTFLLHVARCGSTAVTQAIHSIPNWKVMSESCFIHKHIYQMEHKHKVILADYLKTEKFYRIGEAAIRFMFKDCPQGYNVFYKAFGLLDFCLIPLLSEKFPKHKIITMHRDGQGTCKSHYKAFRDTYAYDFAAYALKNRLIYHVFHPLVCRVLFVVSNGMTSQFTGFLEETKCRDIFLYHFVRWVANSIQYVTYAGTAPNILSVMYEDFRSDKTATITMVRGQDQVLGSQI